MLERAGKGMPTHEDFQRREELRGPSDRSFGWVFTAIFALVGLWPLVQGGSVRLWWLAASAAVLVLTCVRPTVLRPANRAWTRFGLLLSRVTNPIVTGALFFLVVTPLGVLLRSLGKDPLRLRPAPNAASYWIPRDPPGPKPDSMARQF